MQPPLKQRLSWRPVTLSAEGLENRRTVMARAGAYLYAAGALLGLTVLVSGAAPGSDAVGILAVAVAAALIAAVLIAGWDRLPEWSFHLLLALGTLMIAAANLFLGPFDAALLYLWTVLYACYFFSSVAAAAQVVLVAVCISAGVVADGGEPAAGGRAGLTLATLVIAGIVLRLLRRRVASLIDRLAEAARTDPLTGLVNRREFSARFDVELARSQRNGRPLSLVIGDLDAFKAINDRYGHEGGDRALEQASAALELSGRTCDTVARIGGEEFALLLPDTDSRGAYSVAERLRRAVHEAGGREHFELAISFGVATAPGHGADVERLLRNADRAMYTAKELGGDRTIVHDSQAAALATARATVPGELITPPERRRATLADDAGEEREQIVELLGREDGITPVYQPIVALTTGHVAGYEALARFSDIPRRPPPAWFGQAHRVGLGPALEAMAIRVALASPGRPAGTFLTLNISPSALSSPEVQEVLPRDLDGLVLEVTEQEIVSDDHVLQAELATLRRRGARIAIDDAGSAYAGLQQVMRLQPDLLKLDRALVEGIHARADKAALVESFVRFGLRTGATVCAEGIEHLDDLAVLADLDVQYGQGFALARPAAPWAVPESTISETLLRWSLESQSAGLGPFDLNDSSDRRLEHLSARISNVASVADLNGLTSLIADELRADDVAFSLWRPDEGLLYTIGDHRWAPTGESFRVADYPMTEQVLNALVPLQVLASDPTCDPAEIALLDSLGGFRSLLMVPVVFRGSCLGMMEAYSRTDRPWSRTVINHARIVSNQLGAVLANLTDVPGARSSTGLPHVG